MDRRAPRIIQLLEQLETDATLYLEHKEVAMINELCKFAWPLFQTRLRSTKVIRVMLFAVDAEHLWNIELASLANCCIAHHDLASLLLRQRKEIHVNTLRLLQEADSEAENYESSTLHQPETEFWSAFFSASGAFRSSDRPW